MADLSHANSLNSATPASAWATLHVPAMDCPEELRLIRKGLGENSPVLDLQADYLQRRLRVQFDNARIEPLAIAAQISALGFPTTVVNRAAPAPPQSVALRRSTLAAGLLWALAWSALALEGAGAWLSAVLAIASTAVAGWPVVRAGWRAVRLGSLDMNALMTLAAAGAMLTGDYLEAATAMFLFGVSLWLESYSLARARRAVYTLLELSPKIAHRLVAGQVQDVEPDQLQPGDRVVVKPGERLPVDGVVANGRSGVNQAPITGESMPCDKAPGDSVYAGSINGEGALEIVAQRPAHDSTLAHIARLVEQAQQNRSATERFVDRFAKRYTPAVIVLAVLVAAGPPLLAAANVQWATHIATEEWWRRGLVLLVIACPCALVISTPLTIACGLHQAARRGVLVKGGQFLEEAGRIDCLAIDKSGTLTTGRPQVVRILPAGGHGDVESERRLLATAAALESHSHHPLAQAIVAAARDGGLTMETASDVGASHGFGLHGTLRGETHYVGSPRMFREQGLAVDAALSETVANGPQLLTPVLVGTRTKFLGVILLGDEPRADAQQAMTELKDMGIRRLVILSGDQAGIVGRIAQLVGVDEFHADLLPQDKVSAVARLRLEHPRMAMVGDGVNDAPALAASSLGIALGGEASDTALETADVVVLQPQLLRLPEFFRLSRFCRRVLAQNIALALGLKAAVLLLAVAGPPELARLWLAVAADVGASLLVISNGLRLLRPRR